MVDNKKLDALCDSVERLASRVDAMASARADGDAPTTLAEACLRGGDGKRAGERKDAARKIAKGG